MDVRGFCYFLQHSYGLSYSCHHKVLRNQFTGDASFYPPLRKKGRSERSVALHRLIVMPENSIEVPSSISASVFWDKNDGSVEGDSAGIELHRTK